MSENSNSIEETQRLLQSLQIEKDVLDNDHQIFRALANDRDGSILRLLRSEQSRATRKVQGPLAFYIARRCAEIGDVETVRILYVNGEFGVKASVLNALWAAASFPSVVPTAQELIRDGVGSPDQRVRAEACRAAQNLAADRVDMSEFVPCLIKLLSDPSAHVRLATACAVGIFGKHGKYNLSAHIAPLANNLKDTERFVRTYSAKALWRLSRRHDIAGAIEALVSLLSQDDWDLKEARKNCSGALLHHARKSASNLVEVRRQLDLVAPKTTNKEMLALRDKLSVC